MPSLLCALLLSSAQADVVLPPPDGRQYLSHELTLSGLPEGWVLVVAADTKELAGVVSLSADGSTTLATGDDRFLPLGQSPKVWAMTAADHAAWTARADAIAAEQERACSETGEGCVHISRFVPRLPAPAPRLDCGTTLSLRLEGPASGPRTTTDQLEVVSLTDTACALQLTGPAPVPSSPTGPRPPSTSRCSAGAASTSAASLALGIGLLGIARRRSDEPGPG